MAIAAARLDFSGVHTKSVSITPFISLFPLVLYSANSLALEWFVSLKGVVNPELVSAILESRLRHALTAISVAGAFAAKSSELFHTQF